MNIVEAKGSKSKTMLVPPGLTATVVKVSERKVGSGQYGEWSVQRLDLDDGTGRMEASVWNKPDLASLEGSTVTILAKQTDKGFLGAEVEERTWKDNKGATHQVTGLKVSGGVILESDHTDPAPSGTTAQPSNGYKGKLTWTTFMEAYDNARIRVCQGPELTAPEASIICSMLITVSHGDVDVSELANPQVGPGNPDDDIPF